MSTFNSMQWGYIDVAIHAEYSANVNTFINNENTVYRPVEKIYKV